MSLTNRSRLGCIKSRKERLQRKLEKRSSNLQANLATASATPSASTEELSAQKKAWEKYLFAKAIYEETKDMENWRYMQKCISEYEKTIRSNLNTKMV